MVNCDKCNKKFALLEQKYEYIDNQNKKFIYCKKCYDIINQKDEEEKIKTALKKNSKWEYLVKKVNTAFGGSIKVQENELNRLGNEGWELVSSSLVNQGNFIAGQVVTLVIIFKRKL